MQSISGGYDGYPITYDQYGHPIITIGGVASVWGGGSQSNNYSYQEDSHGRTYYVDNTGRTHYIIQGAQLNGAQAFISNLSTYIEGAMSIISKTAFYYTLVDAGYSVMDEVYDEWYEKYFLEGGYE